MGDRSRIIEACVHIGTTTRSVLRFMPHLRSPGFRRRFAPWPNHRGAASEGIPNARGATSTRPISFDDSNGRAHNHRRGIVSFAAAALNTIGRHGVSSRCCHEAPKRRDIIRRWIRQSCLDVYERPFIVAVVAVATSVLRLPGCPPAARVLGRRHKPGLRLEAHNRVAAFGPPMARRTFTTASQSVNARSAHVTSKARP